MTWALMGNEPELGVEAVVPGAGTRPRSAPDMVSGFVTWCRKGIGVMNKGTGVS